ncbi:MAG TPA: cation diffusion facilitator family transporter [Candidatus Aminicenantes bacterium]|nr:cation diffusion facilitator family transporter [Candidatus Aminicenantes bacterium]
MAHAHAGSEHRRPLRLALLITSAVLVVEVAGGLLSGSLALLADAGHMLTDAAALGLALFAFWLSARPASPRRTFGWRRFEIFAAFLNGVALWIVAAAIGYEAFRRFQSPPPVKGGLMLAVAAVGLTANVASGAVLYRGREHSLNVRGAFLHVVADAVGSIGVLAAALLIAVTGSFIWDPVVSAAVCLLILWSSARLIRDAFRVFMEATPAGLDLDALRSALGAIDGVADVHDLHAWTITSGFVSLSAHLKVRAGTDGNEVLRRAHETVSSRFKVRHSTFQIETEEEAACATGSCDGDPPAPTSS